MYPYVVRKSEDMGELTIHAKENCMLPIAAANQSALETQTTLENCTKTTQ